MVKYNFPPAHLVADTPEDLRKLMFLNNKRHNKMFHYFDFSFAKGKWYCWFEVSEKDRVGTSKNESGK